MYYLIDYQVKDGPRVGWYQANARSRKAAMEDALAHVDKLLDRLNRGHRVNFLERADLKLWVHDRGPIEVPDLKKQTARKYRFRVDRHNGKNWVQGDSYFRKEIQAREYVLSRQGATLKIVDTRKAVTS